MRFLIKDKIAGIGASRLYYNNGDGTFTDVTRKAGVDIYVVNKSQANVLYRGSIEAGE